MAVDALSDASFTISLTQKAKKAATGRPQAEAKDTCANAVNWSVGTGAGQFNEAYVALLTIAGGGNTVLDLTALTDTLNNALTLTAVKAIFIQLLGTADFSSDGTTAGTACSGITVGNNATNQFSAPISDSATGTITLANREQFGRCKRDAAGWTVDATHKSLKILNNDGAVSAKVLIGIQGLG